MTNSFVHVEQPTEHPGVARAEAVVSQLRQAKGRLSGARGMAAALLAAVVGAILVVVDRMVANLQDGEMLAMWAIVSALFFVAVSVGVNALLPLGARFAEAWEQAAVRRANARADAQFMAYAAFDPRVMHELQAAITRHESANPDAAPAATEAQRKLAAELPSLYEASRRVRMAYYY